MTGHCKMDANPAAELRQILESLKKLQEPLKQANLHPANLHWAKYLDNLKAIGSQFESLIRSLPPKLHDLALYPERFESTSQAIPIEALLSTTDIPELVHEAEECDAALAASGLTESDVANIVARYNEQCDRVIARIGDIISNQRLGAPDDAEPSRGQQKQPDPGYFTAIVNCDGTALPVPPDLGK